MFPTIAAAFLLSSDNELDSENESNDFLHDDDDSELSIPPTDMDTMETSTVDSSNETDDLEVSTVADDDSSFIDIDADDDNPENVDHVHFDESNEESLQPAPKRFKPDDTAQPDESENVDPSQKCPICLGAWTSEGEHRLCSLRCGHLFGYKCIEQWLNSGNQSNKRCPQCNARASARHIRFLYANKLTSQDYTELENIKKKLEEAQNRVSKIVKALSKERKRTKKYKKMYKARTLALTADSDFCLSD